MATGTRAQSPTDYLDTHQHEATKEYIEYDVDGRMIATYVASYAANDGEPCLKTTYAYDGSSTRIQKRKESLDVWDSAWDI